jgi:hypothetical protein
MGSILAQGFAFKVGRRVAFVRYITLVREKGRVVAEFSGSERARPHIRVGVDRGLFEEFLGTLDFTKMDPSEFGGGFEAVYSTENDWAFEIASLYAIILRALRREERKAKKRKIIDVLLNMHPYELTFWNYQLSKARDRYAQDRVARAFLLLTGIR